MPHEPQYCVWRLPITEDCKSRRNRVGISRATEPDWTAGGEILVSGMFSEIAPARPSKADFTIRRAHKSESEERHVRGASLKTP